MHVMKFHLATITLVCIVISVYARKAVSMDETAASNVVLKAVNSSANTTTDLVRTVNSTTRTSPEGKQYDMKLVLTRDLTTLLVEANITRLSNGSYDLGLRDLYDVTPGPPPGPHSAAAPAAVRAGGYHPRAASDEEVRSAALEAALAHVPVESDAQAAVHIVVCAAASQVVAGTNFNVTLGRGGCSQEQLLGSAIVFRSLQGDWSVTRWLPA